MSRLYLCVFLCIGKIKTAEGDYEGNFVKNKREGRGYFVSGFGDVYGKQDCIYGLRVLD